MNPALYRIRRASAADAAAIAAVHTQAWNEAYRGVLPDAIIERYPLAQRLAMRQRVLASPDRTTCFVATPAHGGGAVGFADCGAAREPVADCRGEVYAVYILAAHQRQGLGRALMAACTRELAERRFTSAMVWVVEGNEPARRFYERLGGKLRGEGTDAHGERTVRKYAYCWPDLATLLGS